MTKQEQSRLDNYDFNQRMRFYILRVDERHGRPIVLVSRSHPNFVRRLFEQEVPEILTDVVEIVTIAREAGSRTKISVRSEDPNVDAVGSCVGQRGMRVQNIIDELNGEKLDIVEWDEDPIVFISNALSPAKVVLVELYDDGTAKVVVPDHQLSLAIGRAGQNARLAARLTGWKIDIESESEYRENKEFELLSHFDDALSNSEDQDDEANSENMNNEDIDLAAIDKAFTDLDQLNLEDEESENDSSDENETDETLETDNIGENETDETFETEEN